MTFTARVTDQGHLLIDNHAGFTAAVSRFRGRDVVVRVERKKHKRSLDQNAYWWAVPVETLAEELGYTRPQMHYALLGECFGYRPGPAGTAVPIKPASSDLSIEEFSHLIDWVLTWAPAELGITLEPPSHWMERHGDAE